VISLGPAVQNRSGLSQFQPLPSGQIASLFWSEAAQYHMVSAACQRTDL